MLQYHGGLKGPARDLRKNMTVAEEVLWSHLRLKQLMAVQFYRQKPLGPFIVDFYAPASRLVIEVDGSQHAEPDHHAKDCQRDDYLADLGITVLRFSNHQVLQATQSMLEAILLQMQAAMGNPPPIPPLSKGG